MPRVGILKYYLPPLFWALLIFIGSSLPAVEALESPVLDFLWHKLAHLLEYSVLYLLVYRGVVRGRFVIDRGKVGASLGLVFLYGLSDEFHQRFTYGRESRIGDVFVDLLGGLIGAIVWSFAVVARRKRSPSEENSPKGSETAP